MKSERVVYINGKFVAEQDAKISIFDSALMFGDMVFEMTRSFNKKQFKLREHLERLYTGVKLVHIPLMMTIDELEQACYETIEKNDNPPPDVIYKTHTDQGSPDPKLWVINSLG